MKNEALPTCPICCSDMKQIKSFGQQQFKFGRKRHECPHCSYSELNDVLREEAIINGQFDEDYV
ncbi:MAG: hypothetical protein QM660_10600 [Dysgonomonas sp.]